MKTKHKFPKMLEEMEYKLHKVMFDLTSEDYHGIEGTYSSSQFKDLVDGSGRLFIKKYVEKSIPREDIPAFGTGTYFHTGTLEPHKLTVDCKVYDGKVRRGAAWEEFQAEHKGKTIITSGQREQAERLITSVKDSPIAMGYIVRGKPEVSLFTELAIVWGGIYAPEFGKELTPDGWRDSAVNIDFKRAKPMTKLVIKVRADSIGDEFILDLKSTTGDAESESAMRSKLSYYQYELSAALYLDMFSLVKPELEDFLWTFASKDFHNSKTYVASKENIRVGRAKYMRAILKLVDLMNNNWEIPDSLGVLEPLQHELEHLKERDTDLL